MSRAAGTTAEGKMHIGEVLNSIYDDEVGWRPASGAIKPVHVANGLIRALFGRHHDTRGVNRFIVWWKAGKSPDEGRSMAAIIRDDVANVFAPFRNAERDFDRARRYASGLLTADGAVFPTAEQSSLTLTCPQMASRDPNDRGLGEFGAALIRSSTSAGALAAAVVDALKGDRPRDPLTALVWPLLDMEGKEVKADSATEKVLSRKHNRACLARLQEAAADLATHEVAQGNRLRTLERVVHFVCVATQVHAQSLAAGGTLRDRIPALIALSGPRRSDLALASERSLDLVYEHFERWLAERAADRIRKGESLCDGEAPVEFATADLRAARKSLQQVGSAKKPHGPPDDETLEARLADFETARRLYGKDDPAGLLGQALVASYLREYESGGPRAFLQGLGRKAGLLYPHFQGRARDKRVQPSVPILDMLVRACVPSGRALPLDDFLERLWDRFGLLVGGRRTEEWDDADVLAERGLPVDANSLVANTDELVSRLVGMGLAKRYPDNVTFVGDGHAG